MSPAGRLIHKRGERSRLWVPNFSFQSQLWANDAMGKRMVFLKLGDTWKTKSEVENKYSLHRQLEEQCED